MSFLLEGDEIFIKAAENIREFLPAFSLSPEEFSSDKDCLGFLVGEKGKAMHGAENSVGIVYCAEGNLFLFIKAPFREQGYGAAALALAIDGLFGSWGMERLTASCTAENTAMKKTLLCCGMEEVEGEDPRRFYAALTMADWERQ